MDLVILPGLLCDSRMFQSQVTRFNAVVIDDFYGRANSITAMARYALDRTPDGAAILGHSMGGRVALEMWRLASKRIDRLAIANSGVHPVRKGEAESRHRLLELGRADGDEALVDAWLPPMMGPEITPGMDVYTRLHAMAVDAGTATYEVQVRALLDRPDAEAVLPTITCPFQAIAARHDSWSPVLQHEQIVAATPGGQLSIIEQAGHMAPAEQPESFNDAVELWLCRAPYALIEPLQKRMAK